MTPTCTPILKPLRDNPDLEPLKLHEDAKIDIDKLAEMKDQSQKREREDKATMAAIVKSREHLRRCLEAQALLVKSYLVRQGREDELGRYIKAYDPSYMARRKAGVPIDEEPEATVTTPESDPTKTP